MKVSIIMFSALFAIAGTAYADNRAVFNAEEEGQGITVSQQRKETISMQKNDTEVQGDRYGTDTVHLDQPPKQETGERRPTAKPQNRGNSSSTYRTGPADD